MLNNINNKYKLYNFFILYNICSQIIKIFGIGTPNNLNKKVCISKNTYFSILKIIHLYRKYNILKRKLVSFFFKQEINNNIRIKIIKKIYQGLRPHLDLDIDLYLILKYIFKYLLIFRNQMSLKINKKKLLKNLKIKKLKLKKNDKKNKMQFKNIINKKNVYFC